MSYFTSFFTSASTPVRSPATLKLKDSVSGLSLSELNELTPLIQQIYYTSSDAEAIGKHVYTPYGAAVFPDPSYNSRLPIYQVFDTTNDKLTLVNTVNLDAHPGYVQLSTSPIWTALVLTPVGGQDPIQYPPCIKLYPTSPTQNLSTPSKTILLGHHDPTRAYLSGAVANGIMAGGWSGDNKYFFYGYTSKDTVTNQTGPYRIGIINAISGTIAAEVDLPNSTITPIEYFTAYHGAKFLKVGNEWYLLFSFYASSFVPQIPPSSPNRMVLFKFNPAAASLTFVTEVNLPSSAVAYDVTNDLRYLVVGGSNATVGSEPSLLQTPPPPINGSVPDPSHELRVYTFNNSTQKFDLVSSMEVGQSIATLKFSPNNSFLAMTTVPLSVGGNVPLRSTGILQVFKVKNDYLVPGDATAVSPQANNTCWVNNSTLFVGGQPTNLFKNFQLYKVTEN